jgi:lysozyme
MRASEKCLQLIKHFESFSPVPYLCPAGLPTIGYGHVIQKTEAVYGRITEPQAVQILVRDVAGFEAIVTRHVRVQLNQGQFDALVSFAFNVGAGAKGKKDGFVTLKNGQPSTMLKLLNAGEYAQAADEFPKWIYGGGKKLAGLVRRREAERKLFEGVA